MFSKASLVTLALALMASAGPLARDTGIRIPLSKRHSLTKADGTFDFERARIEVARIHKYVLMYISYVYGSFNVIILLANTKGTCVHCRRTRVRFLRV
jgi:hypothetical protein